MFSIARDHSTNVKNWQNGTMALRVRRRSDRSPQPVPPRQRPPLHLPALRAALDAHVAETVDAVRHDEAVLAA